MLTQQHDSIRNASHCMCLSASRNALKAMSFGSIKIQGIDGIICWSCWSVLIQQTVVYGYMQWFTVTCSGLRLHAVVYGYMQ